MSRLAVAVLACFMALTGPALASTWSLPEHVSADLHGHGEPAIAADGNGRFVAAWLECPAGSTCRIMTATRGAGGTWSAPQLIAQDAENALAAPRVAMSRAGDAAIAFDGCYAYADCVVRAALRPRGEDAFRPAVEVSPHQGMYGEPAVAVTEEGETTVAWEWIGSGESYQTVRARTLLADDSPAEAGETAGPIRILSSFDADGEQDADPQLVVGADDTVTAAWQRSSMSYDVMSARQLEDGTWTGDARVGMDDPAGWQELRPVLMRGAGSDVFIAYVRRKYENLSSTTLATLHVTRRTGGAWQPPVQLHDFGSAQRQEDLIAGASGAPGELGLVFTGYRHVTGGDDAVRPVSPVSLLRRDPATGEWSAPVEVSNVYPSQQPRIAMDDLGTVTITHSPLTDEGLTQHGTAVTQVTRAGAKTAKVLLSGADGHGLPAVATTPDGTAAVAWRSFDGNSSFIDVAVSGPSAPKASFTLAPAAPVAGERVTFTSTSTDADGTIASHAWDLDDDGDFDDGSAATASATFAGAGTYTVELRVVDDSGRSDVATAEVTVKAVPPAVTDGGDPAPGGGGQAPSSGGGGAPVPAPADPVGFVVGARTDTEGRRAMPNVVGRDLAAARARVTRSLLYADVKATSKIEKASELPKRPGGGRWEIGDVIAQTPAAGTASTTATDQQVPVTLTFWAGARNDRKRCDEIRGEVKGDDLAAAEQQLKAAGCKVPDYEYQASKRATEVEVAKADKDGDVKVTIPADLAKLDLRVWVSGGPVVETSPGPGKDDFSLTAGQKNAIGLIVYDRANRPMRDAVVRFDLHETGGPDLRRPTDAAGMAYGVVDPDRKGVVHAFVEWADRKGEKLYGYAAITVRDRSSQKEFTTLVGHRWRNDGKRFTFAGRSQGRVLARAAGLDGLFDVLRDALAGFGGRVAEVVSGAAAEAEKLITFAKTFRISAQQLWAGQPTNGNFRAGELTRASGGVWRLEPNGVVSAGGANVVAAGGANVVAAGGANIIGQAAGNVVSAGGANAVAAGGANLLAVKGGFLLSDNGLGLRAGQGDIVRLPDGSRLLSDNGLGVVAAGGANLIGAAGGN